MKRLLLVAFLLAAFSGVSLAEELSGEKAIEFIGGLENQLTGRAYSVILLKRRDPAPVTQAHLDGIVFAPADYKYRYIRRLDDDHRLRLSPTRGNIADAAKAGESDVYEALIRKNKLYPRIILGKDKKALLIIYRAIQESVSWSLNKNNEILLEVRNPFKSQSIDLPFNNPLFRGTK